MDAKAMRLRRESLELPLLKSLVELGGSVSPDESLYHLVADKAGIGEDAEYDIVHARPKWVYDLQWVRHTLVKQGEIDGSVHGLWQITESGRNRIASEWAKYRPGVPLDIGQQTVSATPTEISIPLEQQAEKWIVEYYQSRADRLRVVRIEHLLPLMNPYALCLERVGAAYDLVRHALDAYLALTEQSIFGTCCAGRQPRGDDWLGLTGSPASGEEIVKLIQIAPFRVSLPYIDERAKAINRLMVHLIEEFGTPDFGIDWEKIVRLNSGIDGGKD